MTDDKMDTLADALIDGCPDHPDVMPEVGFGLAGGGYGAYTYCPICSRIIDKTQEHPTNG